VKKALAELKIIKRFNIISKNWFFKTKTSTSL